MHPHLLSLRPARRHLFRGAWLSVAEIAELTGINSKVIYARIKRGQPVDEARKKQPRLYSFKDQLMTAKQVAEITGLSVSGVYLRACGDRILDDKELREQRERYAEPHPLSVMLTYRGKKQNMTAWAHELGIGVSTLHARLMLGWTMERIVSEPVMSPIVRGTIVRNRKIISRLTMGFRRARNTQLIHRIASAFDHRTGGYIQTSHSSQGTGVWRHAHHLDQISP
jgi:predicted DNA-binding transcriptional regulator AlpA